MIQFNFTCRDGTGRGAAITGPLKDAGINIESVLSHMRNTVKLEDAKEF